MSEVAQKKTLDLEEQVKIQNTTVLILLTPDSTKSNIINQTNNNP